jgi:hypothetical protein
LAQICTRGWEDRLPRPYGKFTISSLTSGQFDIHMNELRDLLLLQLDQTWNDPWESIQSALINVDEALASWQPDCYASEPPEAHWPPAGTVKWHVAHLAACKLEYLGKIRSRSGVPASDDEYLPRATLADGVQSLAEIQVRLRNTIEALTDRDLGDLVTHGKSMPLADFIAMIIRHDAWHAAQIKLVQRMKKADRSADRT